MQFIGCQQKIYDLRLFRKLTRNQTYRNTKNENIVKFLKFDQSLWKSVAFTQPVLYCKHTKAINVATQ